MSAPAPGSAAVAAPPSRQDQLWSALTHGLGALLAVVALGWLVHRASGSGDGLKVASAAVFGCSLVFLYVASTLYHSLADTRAHRALRIADHVGIYLLIAGSYTPFALVSIGGSQGWLLFGIIWSLTALGVSLEVAWLNRPRWISAAVYVALGWLMVFFLGQVSAAIPTAALVLLIAGGAVYTLGTLFYVSRRIPYNHAIWHMWVIGGSACHIASVGLFIG